MLEVKGKYNTAKVFTDNLEESGRVQIERLCDQPYAADSKIRMMPDVHAGAGREHVPARMDYVVVHDHSGHKAIRRGVLAPFALADPDAACAEILEERMPHGRIVRAFVEPQSVVGRVGYAAVGEHDAGGVGNLHRGVCVIRGLPREMSIAYLPAVMLERYVRESDTLRIMYDRDAAKRRRNGHRLGYLLAFARNV